MKTKLIIASLVIAAISSFAFITNKVEKSPAQKIDADNRIETPVKGITMSDLNF